MDNLLFQGCPFFFFSFSLFFFPESCGKILAQRYPLVFCLFVFSECCWRTCASSRVKRDVFYFQVQISRLPIYAHFEAFRCWRVGAFANARNVTRDVKCCGQVLCVEPCQL